MEIAIGLPNAEVGTTGDQLTEWARRAENAGFSSLGTIDRLAYPGIESIAALAAAAAVTERIRLATSILIAPLRVNAVMLAKQLASVQHLSGGRLVAGLAVGPREDDYTVGGLDFDARGKQFDEMLPKIKQTWADSGGDYTVGPDVSQNPPQLLIGGQISAAFARVGEYGDGWIQGAVGPDQLREGREQAIAAWRDAGREGEPRIASLAYYSLGDDPVADAQHTLGHYYAWLGDEVAGYIVGGAAKDADTIRSTQEAFEDAGCDELIWFGSSADPDQVDRLAEVAL